MSEIINIIANNFVDLIILYFVYKIYEQMREDAKTE